MQKHSKDRHHVSEEVRKRSSSNVERRRHQSQRRNYSTSYSADQKSEDQSRKLRRSVSDGRATEKESHTGKSDKELQKGPKRGRQTSSHVGMFKAKILVIGPRECGKTVISNYLADATEISGGDYHPTQGVRILEFESSGISVGGKEVSCEVELWDCSGDQKFENCWPAIQKDANGVLFVYNPDKINHGKELETLYVHFVQESGLRDNQCMLFAHHKPGTNAKSRQQAPSYLSKIPCVQTNLEEDPDMVKKKFSDLLSVLLRSWTDRRDQEELSIMNH